MTQAQIDALADRAEAGNADVITAIEIEVEEFQAAVLNPALDTTRLEAALAVTEGLPEQIAAIVTLTETEEETEDESDETEDEDDEEDSDGFDNDSFDDEDEEDFDEDEDN